MSPFRPHCVTALLLLLLFAHTPSLHGEITTSIDLIAITSLVTGIFIDRTTMLYQILRPDVRIQRIEASHNNTAPVVKESDYNNQTTSTGFGQLLMQYGLGDLAFISFHPTAADRVKAPDLEYFPLWANPFGAVYNLPGIYSLTLSPLVVARIFRANITRWNDAAIVALNPRVTLPNQPITVCTQGDAITFAREFTRISSQVDPVFSSEIGLSNFPHWPTSRYSNHAVVYGLSGAASYVGVNAYSIGISLTSFAGKLGAASATMVNAAGNTVSPTFESTYHALVETMVQSSLNADGTSVDYSWTGVLVNAPGASAWPYVSFAGLVIPRSFSRQSCRARSEMVKFVRWMLASKTVRYDLGQQELVVMISEDMDEQLGLTAFLKSLECEDAIINTGDLFPFVIAGSILQSPTSLISPRTLLLEYYTHTVTSDSVSIVEKISSPTAALESSLIASREPGAPDLAWLLPLQFPYVRNREHANEEALGIETPEDHLKQVNAVNKNALPIPLAVQGIAFKYNLPSAVRVLMEPYLPLKIDINTLALIFAGEIRNWTDARLVAFNPKLPAAFATAGSFTGIVMIVAGDGAQEELYNCAVSNHLMILLKDTPAFKQLAAEGRLDSNLVPANWTGITSKTSTHVYAAHERLIYSTVELIPNSLGYTLLPDSVTSLDHFTILRTVTRVTATIQVPIPPTVASLRECARAAALEWSAANIIDGVPSDPLPAFRLDGVVMSTKPAWADCYPFSFLLGIGLPFDPMVDVGIKSEFAGRISRIDPDYICERGFKLANFARWIMTTHQPLWEMNGAAHVATVPEIANQVQIRLNKLTCSGKPLLWTPDVVWELPQQWKQFAVATFSIGIVLLGLVVIILVIHRHRTLVKSASYWFQTSVIIGIGLILASLLILVSQVNKDHCNALSWTISLGFTFAITMPTLKIWKVWQRLRTVNQRSLRRGFQWTPYKLMALGAIFVLADIILLAIMQSSYGGMLKPVTSTSLEGEVIHQSTVCFIDDDSLPLAVVLVAIKACVLAGGSLLGLATTKAASAFNENSHLSWAVWNATLTCALFIPIISLMGDGITDTLGAALELILIAWISISTILFVFGSRIYQLVRNRVLEQIHAMGAVSSALSSFHTSATGTGTGMSILSGSALESALELHPIDHVALVDLEKYILVLEGHIRSAKARRLKELGPVSQPKDDEASLIRPQPTNGHKQPVGPSKRKIATTPADESTPIPGENEGSTNAKRPIATSSVTNPSRSAHVTANYSPSSHNRSSIVAPAPSPSPSPQTDMIQPMIASSPSLPSSSPAIVFTRPKANSVSQTRQPIRILAPPS